MKKIICAGLALLMCGGLVFSVTACSGDDDDDNGNSGVVNNDLGLRVIAVGDYKYSYYDDGKLEAIYFYNEPIKFTYKPDKITFSEEEDEYRDEPNSVDVSYTSQGYLKSLSLSDEEYKLSAVYTYDGDGHLTKISSSYSAPNEKYRNEATLTWRNDLLRMIVWGCEDYDEDETDSESHRITFDYDGDNPIENPYLQFAASLIEFVGIGDGDLEEGLAHIGKLGKGPKYLPSACQREWEETEGSRVRNGSSKSEFKYGFNIDNALSYVMIGNERINYRYEFVDSRISKSNDIR